MQGNYSIQPVSIELQHILVYMPALQINSPPSLDAPMAEKNHLNCLWVTWRSQIKMLIYAFFNRVNAVTDKSDAHLWCLALWEGCSKICALPRGAELHAPLLGTEAGSTFGCLVKKKGQTCTQTLEPMRKQVCSTLVTNKIYVAILSKEQKFFWFKASE